MEASKFSSSPICRRPASSSLDKESKFAAQGQISFPFSSNHYLGIPWLSHRQCKATKSSGFGLRLNKFPFSHVSHPSSLSRSCKVKSEDSEGTLTGESIIPDEQTLEQELHIAVKEENYAKAAQLRDSLRSLQSDSKTCVLAANGRFYSAFRNGNLAAMQALWSKGDNVCVVHPGVSGISGYDLVMGSWEFVWADYEFPLEIDIKDVQVHVKGDVGYVTCIEMVRTKGSSWGKQFATNVFEKIDGQWHICIHHASYVDL